MTDFDDFFALGKKWASLYRTKETTYLSVRHNGTWYLLYSRELFHVDELIDATPLHVDTSSLRAGQFRTAIDESKSSAIMERTLAERGKVTVGQWSVSLSTNTPVTERFDRLYPARAPGQMRVPVYVMQSGAIDLTNLKDALALELLACNTPYESVEELCGELRVPIAPGELTQMTHTEIFLGNPFLFDESCALNDGRLNLKIVAPCGVEPNKVKVSVKAFFAANSPPRRFVIPASDFTSTERDGKVLHECSVEMSDVPLALALISYDGEFCHRWWLRDQSRSFSPRYQLHRLLDSGNKFEKTFFDSRNEFEHRIALLLSLMNLAILPYGRIPELQDAPDILAYSTGNDLYVVECTTGDIDQKGKLQKLCGRTRDIAANAQQSSVAISNLFSVVFTSLPRTDIAPHLTKLEALRISVFCREDIERVLKRVEAPPTADEVRNAVQALIPTGTMTQGAPLTLS
jgi:hypothetical protein